MQGLNKEESKHKFGKEQVMLWRRSAGVRPPLLEQTDLRNPCFDEKYKNIKEPLPLGENLLDTEKRVVDYFNDEINYW